MRRLEILLAFVFALVGLGAVPADAWALTEATPCYSGTPSKTTPTAGTLHHPEISLIFWGSQWTQGGQPASYGQIIAAVQSLVGGAYFSELNEYAGLYSNDGDTELGNGIDLPRMVPQAVVYTGAFPGPGGTYTNCDINNVINTLISNGSVPKPNDLTDMIYAVFIPAGVHQAVNPSEPGAYCQPVGGDLSQHQECLGGSCSCPSGTCPNTDTFYWARIQSGLALNASPSTWTTSGVPAMVGFSHEVAEAITNPTVALAGGATVTPPNGCGGTYCPEIADVCICPSGANGVTAVSETYDGYKVQAYWSQQNQACVIPEGYSDTWRSAGGANNWTLLTTNPVRQLTAGTTSASGSELFVEDSSGNLWTWVASQGAWALLPAPPAGASMFAVTTFGPWVLASDASAIYQYNGSSWQKLASFPNPPVTSIVGGGVPVATDPYGQIWRYTGTGWTLLKGSPGYWADKLIGNGQTLWMLGSDRSLSFTTGGAWTSWGGFYADIFTGGAGASAIFATEYDQTQIIQLTSANMSVQVSRLGPGTSPALLTFAVDDSNNLFGLGSGALQNPIYQANNPNAADAGWTQIATVGARLVGQGDKIYATNGITF